MLWLALLGLGALALYASGAPAGAPVRSRDQQLDPQAAAAFEQALAQNANPGELRTLAAGALTLGSAVYARELLRRALELEGVPAEQLDEQTDRQLALGNITRPPPRQEQPAQGSPTTPGGPRGS